MEQNRCRAADTDISMRMRAKKRMRAQRKEQDHLTHGQRALVEKAALEAASRPSSFRRGHTQERSPIRAGAVLRPTRAHFGGGAAQAGRVGQWAAACMVHTAQPTHGTWQPTGAGMFAAGR